MGTRPKGTRPNEETLTNREVSYDVIFGVKKAADQKL